MIAHITHEDEGFVETTHFDIDKFDVNVGDHIVTVRRLSDNAPVFILPVRRLHYVVVED